MQATIIIIIVIIVIITLLVGIQKAWKDNLDNYPMEWVRVNDQIWGKIIKRLNRQEIG